jgi:hypothetical protein
MGAQKGRLAGAKLYKSSMAPAALAVIWGTAWQGLDYHAAGFLPNSLAKAYQRWANVGMQAPSR